MADASPMERLVPVAVAVLVLTACGELREPVIPVDQLDPTVAVEYALRKTLQAGSASMSFELEADVGDRTVRFGGDAEIVFDPPAQHMRMGYPRLGPGAPAGEVEIILVDLVVYVRSARNLGGLEAPTPWVSMDLRRLARSDRIAGLLEQQSDPTQMLNYLHGAVDAREVGTETLTGAVATRYEVRVDLERLLQRMPEGFRALSKASLARLGHRALDSLSLDVWIDRDGYVRREAVAVQVPGAGGSLEMVVELDGFGAEYDIEPPAAADVTDVSELARGRS
jgi:hypothetical protein